VKLPRYVETDKQVARFYGHFFQERPFDKYGPLGDRVVERYMARFMTIHVYVYDGTVEINEPKETNSGMSQGTFYRRGVLYKSDGERVTLQDLVPGNVVSMLGRDFHITDADAFTRDYFKRELNIILPPAISRPETMMRDIAAQYATGLGMKTKSLSKDSFNTMSTDYLNTKAILEKTNRFLQFDGKVLRFLCVEVFSAFPPYFPSIEQNLSDKGQSIFHLSNGHGFVASANVKKFAISYYLSSNEMELVVQKTQGERDVMSADEPRLILKKTMLPRNWRESQNGAKAIYYSPDDLQCGHVIDVFGRLFLLVKCDSFTQQFYSQKRIDQSPVPLIEEEVEKIVQPIPELGDGTLPIGSQEDTLATVYGMPKVTKDVLKMMRNQNRFIRCKARLLSDDPIDATREFLITFFLEDDSIQVYEEKKRNSGIWSGTFLRRGKYINEFPSDPASGARHAEQMSEVVESAEPRPFHPNDIYLGAVIYLNGSQFQIIEMDNLSLAFCESYPHEFPLMDTFRIIGTMMVRILAHRVNLRPVFEQADREGKCWLPAETFLSRLDSLQLTHHLNDQELLTLMRRFKDDQDHNKIWYHEMADLLSHVHYQHRRSKKLLKDTASLASFLKTARSRTVQWRRSLRKDHFTVNGNVALDELAKLLQKHELDCTERLLEEIAAKYSLSDQEAKPVLKELNRLHEVGRVYEELLDDKVQYHDNPSNTHHLGRQPSSSTLTSSKSKNVIDLNKIHQLRKRKASMVSLLRNKVTQANEPGSEVRAVKLNHRTTIIDFNKLCNDIYVCDWV